jgi:glycogen synthase kinase 3 beta
LTAIDDASKLIRVVASDGRTGEQREIAYTNCKVVGNVGLRLSLVERDDAQL